MAKIDIKTEDGSALGFLGYPIVQLIKHFRHSSKIRNVYKYTNLY